jgi:outer membrane biosynthesis protein TonB
MMYEVRTTRATKFTRRGGSAVAQLILVKCMRTRIIALTAVALMVLRVSAAASPHITAEQARQWLISAPQPAYPESARLSRIQGSGYFKLIVRVKTGRIQRIAVFRSTGNSILTLPP